MQRAAAIMNDDSGEIGKWLEHYCRRPEELIIFKDIWIYEYKWYRYDTLARNLNVIPSKGNPSEFTHTQK